MADEKYFVLCGFVSYLIISIQSYIELIHSSSHFPCLILTKVGQIKAKVAGGPHELCPSVVHFWLVKSSYTYHGILSLQFWYKLHCICVKHVSYSASSCYIN